MNKVILFLLLALLSCGKDKVRKSSHETQNVSGIFASSQLQIKVFYEPGAEPYDSVSLAGILNLSPWELFATNMETLFSKRTPRPALTVPKTLSEMTAIKVMNKSTWTPQEVVDLANTLSVAESSGTMTFKFLFLNGHASQSVNIIGFHISNTNIIAIFKDVIRNTQDASYPEVPKYVEQATLIHEMGHALGLVNNGLPMHAGNHQDSSHGAHCTNPDCVMYYANEGTNSMVSYVKKVIAEKSTLMFDSQCVKDVQNYKK